MNMYVSPKDSMAIQFVMLSNDIFFAYLFLISIMITSCSVYLLPISADRCWSTCKQTQMTCVVWQHVEPRCESQHEYSFKTQVNRNYTTKL